MKHLISPKATALLVLLLLLSSGLNAQEAKQEPIELLQASELEMMREGGIETRYLRATDTSKVVFRQGDMLMRCKEAIQFPDSNFVVAYGQIEVERGDSIRLYGDTILYYGNERFAEIRSRVRFTDQHVLIRTSYMYYDLIENTASYQFGGKVTDPNTELTSRKGYYHTELKMLGFKGQVVLDNRKSEYHIETDTLAYHTVDKIAYFPTKTSIDSKDGHLDANSGEYYSQQSRSVFRQGAKMENEEYILEAQNLEYDEIADSGEGRGKVRIFNKQDSLTIYGDEGFFRGEEKLASVMGNALVEKPMSGDTLFLLADTLYSYTDTLDSRILLAYPMVRIFSSDLEGICDSLSYHASDSIIHFFKDPVLWSGNSQMEADSISGYMRGGGLDKLLLKQKAFVASKDTLGMFNQMKGRTMDVWLTEGRLKQVDVNGNGESLYFALEKDTSMIGANKVTCSSMVLRFSEQSAVQTITFIRKAEANFTPPHELSRGNTKLEGFQWRADERPNREEIALNPNRPAPAKPAKPVVVEQEKMPDMYGELISRDGGFYVFLEGDTLLTFYLTSGDRSRTASYFFYADIIPRSQADLADEWKLKKLQQVARQATEEELGQKPFVMRLSLPAYPKFTIRFGQYSPNASGGIDYGWTGSHNFYKSTVPDGKAVPQAIPEEYKNRRKKKDE